MGYIAKTFAAVAVGVALTGAYQIPTVKNAVNQAVDYVQKREAQFNTNVRERYANPGNVAALRQKDQTNRAITDYLSAERTVMQQLPLEKRVEMNQLLTR